MTTFDVMRPLFTPVRPTIAAVYAAQRGRARAGGGAVVVIATVQSLAILALLRGWGGATGEGAQAAVVSGATLTVVAFIGWNLLAQRLAAVKAGGGLDYFGTLPIRPAAVVLGFCAAYATFALPGVVLTAVAGSVLFSLPVGHLWVLIPAFFTSCVTFGGLGALCGLAPSRPETATLAGQFGLTAVMFFGLVPPQSLPSWLSGLRAVVPVAYDIDALASALTAHPDWPGICLRLAGSVVVGAGLLAAATRAYRKALDR